jgi:hypothetical protein
MSDVFAMICLSLMMSPVLVVAGRLAWIAARRHAEARPSIEAPR